MKLSVIIPMFNKLEFNKQILWECFTKMNILSTDGEMIVIDNGSTDGTTEYIAAASHSFPIKHIKLPQNIYVNPAWNLGAEQASGEYFLFLNNDILLPYDLDKTLIDACEPGYVACPVTQNASGVGAFYQMSNINGAAFMIRAADWNPIDSRLKLWYGDDQIFRTLDTVWSSAQIKHMTSTTINTLPELEEVLQGDHKAWAEILKEKGWTDSRFS